MTATIVVFAGTGILGVLVTIVAVVRDGYRRAPEVSPTDRVSRWR